jgi:predicted alpha/beta hydrolase family esterase
MLKPPRLLIIPGLHDSGDAHWQSWLQRQFRDAQRVRQRDFTTPDLARWSERIDAAVDRGDGQGFIAVAHSFGTLALVEHLARCVDTPIRAALLVAPADPDKFGISEALPRGRVPRPLTLVYSMNDPWMTAGSARRWALAWGAHAVNLGSAGHINTEAGFGPLPIARRWVDHARARWARESRPQRADLREWHFAI